MQYAVKIYNSKTVPQKIIEREMKTIKQIKVLCDYMKQRTFKVYSVICQTYEIYRSNNITYVQQTLLLDNYGISGELYTPTIFRH